MYMQTCEYGRLPRKELNKPNMQHK